MSHSPDKICRQNTTLHLITDMSEDGLPAPLIAALIHYQFVTIHPYYDGNGRTARLLATFILHRGGYSLGGFFSLEEHHARDLDAYYGSLAVHTHHNYYDGRAEADLTVWLEYFMTTLSEVFTSARGEALQLSAEGVSIEPQELRRLDHRARVVLSLFDRTNQITTAQVAEALGLSPRMARMLLRDWVGDGWLEKADASNRNRAYGLSAMYRQRIGKSRTSLKSISLVISHPHNVKWVQLLTSCTHFAFLREHRAALGIRVRNNRYGVG